MLILQQKGFGKVFHDNGHLAGIDISVHAIDTTRVVLKDNLIRQEGRCRGRGEGIQKVIGTGILVGNVIQGSTIDHGDIGDIEGCRGEMARTTGHGGRQDRDGTTDHDGGTDLSSHGSTGDGRHDSRRGGGSPRRCRRPRRRGRGGILRRPNGHLLGGGRGLRRSLVGIVGRFLGGVLRRVGWVHQVGLVGIIVVRTFGNEFLNHLHAKDQSQHAQEGKQEGIPHFLFPEFGLFLRIQIFVDFARRDGVFFFLLAFVIFGFDFVEGNILQVLIDGRRVVMLAAHTRGIIVFVIIVVAVIGGLTLLFVFVFLFFSLGLMMGRQLLRLLGLLLILGAFVIVHVASSQQQFHDTKGHFTRLHVALTLGLLRRIVPYCHGRLRRMMIARGQLGELRSMELTRRRRDLFHVSSQGWIRGGIREFGVLFLDVDRMMTLRRGMRTRGIQVAIAVTQKLTKGSPRVRRW